MMSASSLRSQLPTKVFKGHTDAVWSVACFRDNKRIVSGSGDKTVRIWNVESEKQEGHSLEHDFEVTCVSISPDERTLAVSGFGDGKCVVLWNLESRSVVWKTEEEDMVDGPCLAFSPDGQLIAATAADEDIVLLDVETGQQIGEPLQMGEDIASLAFSPDGTQVVAGSSRGKVRVFDVATGQTVLGPITANKMDVTSALFTPDGKQIITALYGKSIRVWDGSTGQEVGNPILWEGSGTDWAHSGTLRIALSHDGRRLAGAGGGSVRVWDRNTRRQLGGSLSGARAHHPYPFLSVAWSANAQFIVSGARGADISLWDVPPLEVEDSAMPPSPVVVAANPPQPSSSRSRTSSLSPSILDLPARAPTPTKPKPNPPSLPADFWDVPDSDPDLPVSVNHPISSVPRAKPATANLPSPEHTAEELHPPASPFEPLARLWNQLPPLDRWMRRKPRQGRDDTHEMQPAHPPPISTPPANVPDMQPPPRPRPPRTPASRMAKVSAAHGFSRNHAATSNEDDEVPFCDYVCYCMCCPCKRSLHPDSDLESDSGP